MDKKKLFKIIVLNFLAILISLTSIEICSRLYCYKELDNFLRSFHTISVDTYFNKLLNNESVKGALIEKYRPDIITNSKKKPILFMGCSFAWGHKLEEKQTISAKIEKLTGRSVYNRAGMGWGLAQLLYQLKHNDFYKNIEEPEYLIYVFLVDHLYRLHYFKLHPKTIDFQPKFKVINGSLAQEKPKFYHNFHIVNEFMRNYKPFYSNKSLDDEFDLLSLYFVSSKNEMNKHWKDTKFVILKYQYLEQDHGIIDNNRWEELENEGFIILEANKLANAQLYNKSYLRPNDNHPNEKAWDLIAPALVKKLSL